MARPYGEGGGGASTCWSSLDQSLERMGTTGPLTSRSCRSRSRQGAGPSRGVPFRQTIEIGTRVPSGATAHSRYCS